MSLFKKATFILFLIVAGLHGFCQESDPADTLLIIDSSHQEVETPFDDDSDFPESSLGATSRFGPRIPDTLSFRKVADSIPARLKKQKDFEYANDPEYWIKKPQRAPDPETSIWEK